MTSLSNDVGGWRDTAAKQRPIRAANDNGGRKITIKLKPPSNITVAEIEVFGALLAQLEAAAANDNVAKETAWS